MTSVAGPPVEIQVRTPDVVLYDKDWISGEPVGIISGEKMRYNENNNLVISCSIIEFKRHSLYWLISEKANNEKQCFAIYLLCYVIPWIIPYICIELCYTFCHKFILYLYILLMIIIYCN